MRYTLQGFAPVTLMSTSSTLKHPVMISIESGDPEEVCAWIHVLGFSECAEDFRWHLLMAIILFKL